MFLQRIKTSISFEITSFGGAEVGERARFRFVLCGNMTRKVFLLSETLSTQFAAFLWISTPTVSVEAALSWERIATSNVRTSESKVQICIES